MNLYAWAGGRLVGVFRRTATGEISFEYEDTTDFVISLSLPRAGVATRRAAERFLDGLLPDNPIVRQRWAMRHNCPNTPFDLIAALGADTPGALVFSTSPELRANGEETVLFVSDDEIAHRIATLRHDSASWIPPEATEIRLSLAGAQGKFSLARIEDTWAWPTTSTPSTHIFKPPVDAYPDLGIVEAAMLQLAHAIGIPAASARVQSFKGQRTFSTLRFDRVADGDFTRRRHIEDMAQALGRNPEEKYQISAIDIFKLLGQHAPDQRIPFLKQLAFNTVIGNCDAHAKNYSLLLGNEIRLAPLYDAVPTMLYPGLTTRLSMRIGNAHHAAAVTEQSWLHLARRVGLDSDEALITVRDVYAQALEQAPEILNRAGASPELRDRMLALIKQIQA